MSLRLIGFIRHGPTPWNAQRRMQGRADIPLSEESLKSYRRLRPPDDLKNASWHVSPLTRARQTAEALGISRMAIDERLIEMDFGEWEGKTLADLRAAAPREMAARERRGPKLDPPGGETPEHLQKRLRHWLDDLAGGDSPVGAVTHLGVIRAALVFAYGWDMLEKPPVTVDWHAAHLFHLASDGRLKPHRLNVPLVKVTGNDR